MKLWTPFHSDSRGHSSPPSSTNSPCQEEKIDGVITCTNSAREDVGKITLMFPKSVLQQSQISLTGSDQ